MQVNSKLEKFEVASVVKCLLKQWKEKIYTQDNFLSFNFELKRDIEIKIKSKGVYKNIIKEITIPPTSENFFKSNFDITNDFEKIYCITSNARIYKKLIVRQSSGQNGLNLKMIIGR